ncbi:MAG: AAA family ATPase [Caldilineaceae bacterium]
MSSLSEGRRRYEELVKGEGIFKTVFKAVKAASGGQGLDRVFITGVSPIVMADISSGYNVAENIYLTPALNPLCGFTEPEIAQILHEVAQANNFTTAQTDEALQTMRTFYNGYCFSTKAAEPIYNPTLALYFLKALQQNGAYPDEMLDSNLAMDRARLFYVAKLGGAKELLNAALNEQEPLTVTTLAQRFGIAELLSGKKKSTEYLAALLYYLGVLTLDRRTALRKLVLRIPNLVIRELYVERLRELLLPDVDDQEAGQRAAETFFVTGDLQPLCDFVEQRLFRAYDNRDYMTANELTIKTAFLTLLFNDRLYIVDSETAIQRTYADITLIRRPDLRDEPDLLDLILEFKYVKLSEVSLDGVAARQLNRAELLALPAIQVQLAAAQTQLQGYRQAMQQQYGDLLRLRTYAVVALRFERVVWEEV